MLQHVQQFRRDVLAIDGRNQMFMLVALALAGAIGLVSAALLIQLEELAFLLFGAPVFALAVRYPRHAVYLFVAAFPLTIGLPRGFGGIPLLRLGEVLMVVVFAAVMINGLLNHPWKLRLGPLDLGMFAIVLTGSIIPTLVVEGRRLEVGAEGFNVLVGPIKYLLVYRMIRSVVQTREHVRTIIHCLLFASTIVGLVGIGQRQNILGIDDFVRTYYMDEGTRQWISRSWLNPEAFRITSLMSNWNVAGSYLSFSIIIAIYYAQTFTNGWRWMLWLGPVIAINGLALILTGNTSSTLGLIGAIALGTLYLRRLPRGAVLLVIGAILSMIFFSNFVMLRLTEQFGGNANTGVTGNSFFTRVSLWQTQFLPVLEGNYLLGIGPELPDQIWWNTEESQYLFLLYKGGIFYLIGYLAWVGLTLWMCKRAMDSSDELARMLGLAGALVMVALLYMGISNAYATYTPPMANVWILLAIVSAASTWATNETNTTSGRTYAQPTLGPETHPDAARKQPVSL
ncbi:MAG: hypothetical protein HC828_11915 [Blastochloris sp.]|nr:hypothetical protein [Blastochloris sp.]